MIEELLIFYFGALIIVFFYSRRHFAYWKRKGIAHSGPSAIVKTVLDLTLGRAHVGKILQRGYEEYKAKGQRYFGSWHLSQPVLIIIDLDLSKQILTKDFHHFVSRGLGLVTHEYISKQLFSLEGQEWKDMRVKLTPTFSSGKMKNMFILMKKCTEQLQEYIDEVVLQNGRFDAKDLCARLTSDIIATCAFGLELNCIRFGENDFITAGKPFLYPPNLVLAIWNYAFLIYFPNLARIFNVNSIPPKYPKLFLNLVKDTIDYRKANKVIRNDFLDLLMNVNNSKDKEEVDSTSGHCDEDDGLNDQANRARSGQRLTLEEMTAQASLFFVAGFEAAASTTSFCLYELALNPEIQDKLAREVDEVLSNHGGELSYQALQEMTYMDQVTNETLRRYGPSPFLTRVCTEPYKVPGSSLVLEKGIRINIPSYAIHHDPDIYSDPYRFDPERFSEQNCKNRHHYSFLPFGEGPRNCIAGRFARMQVKAALVAILSKYQLTPSPDTPTTVQLNTHALVTSSKHPIFLNISRRI